MKQSTKWLWVISGIFVLTFAFTCLMDFEKPRTFDSAPYYAYVLARAIEFLLPAAFFAIAALIRQYRGRS